MTEGNVASWRVKEGDKFAAGDVLLEIETDKATMDVEAQEDGIMMKIMAGDGSKAVQVGTRIAVLAEEGDDISSLEIPPDSSPKPKQESKEASKSESQSASQPPAESTTPAPQPKSKGKAPKQTYPLLPSVIHLVKENGLEESAIGEMTPTGPNGRLLKGDVLAYLGKIKASTPADVSARFEKASHLDLSNIKIAKRPEAKQQPAKAAPAPVEQDSFVTLPVTLGAAVKVQKKVHETLGIFLPLSTLITRAADIANDELPLPTSAPTVDELFDQVLGLDKVGPSASRGSYLPQVSALPPASLTGPRPTARRPVDIIDVLAGSSRAAAPKAKKTLPPGLSSGINVFSLSVPKQEEKRARVFLERVKLVLENDPGRLVL